VQIRGHEITSKDILSPANAISVAGFGLSVHGASRVNTVCGVLEMGLGSAGDVLDGPVARRTHTSWFGKFLDASLDKVRIAVMVREAWRKGAAPKPLLGAFVVQNAANAVLTTYAEAHGIDLDANKKGKRSMFLQSLSIGSFALGNATERAILEKASKTVGIVSAIGGLALGVAATKEYYDTIQEEMLFDQSEVAEYESAHQAQPNWPHPMQGRHYRFEK
jgi:phosphatidylglycerophosphate synthase